MLRILVSNRNRSFFSPEYLLIRSNEFSSNLQYFLKNTFSNPFSPSLTTHVSLHVAPASWMRMDWLRSFWLSARDWRWSMAYGSENQQESLSSSMASLISSIIGYSCSDTSCMQVSVRQSYCSQSRSFSSSPTIRCFRPIATAGPRLRSRLSG